MPTPVRTRYFPCNVPFRLPDDPGLEAPPAKGRYEVVITMSDGTVKAGYVTPPDLLDPVAPDPGRPASARPEPPDADAVACRFAETRHATVRFCFEARAWFVWDGTIWRRDRIGAVRGAIRETARAMGDAAAPARITSPYVGDIEASARAEPSLAAAAWDADPWLLGTPGGTVDLGTGLLRPADPCARITRATSVVPAATAACPIWRRFLDETTRGDAALAGFLQRFLGYALTGETCEHALVHGVGDGGTGKSVFVNTVRGIFGDYAAVAAPDLFAQGAERRAGQGNARIAHSTEIAMLAGARLVTASETEEGRVWAEGRLKLLTGGDPVTARFLGADHFTFTPRFKLLVIGNHMPMLRTVDAAIRRRLCVVPFAARPDVPDRTLQARLTDEWPAILRWMIEGCLAWQAEGLAPPRAVREATDAYLGGQDIVGQFLADLCETAPAYEESAAALYAAWCTYAKAVGEAPGTGRLLGATLDRRGFTRERTRFARMYRGLRLRREE